VYVNGVRISGPTAVRPGDWISLGQSTLEVLELEALPTDRAPASRVKPPSEPRKATHPGSALMAIAGVAERALAGDNSCNGEQMLNAPLEAVLKAAIAGRHVSAHDAQMAAVLAARLAEAGDGGRWVRYCFRLYAALGRPLPTQAIDRLYQIFHRAGPRDVRELQLYLAVLDRLPPESLGDAGSDLLRRIAGLADLARRAR
jgi:hypothetical protein